MKFDWENNGPCPEALTAFKGVKDESEFPDSYSGQAWRMAYRIWLETKQQPDLIAPDTDGWDERLHSLARGLDLTGFMVGWALNAVRQMMGKPAGTNPAILKMGAGANQPKVPAMGSADQDLRRALE